MSSYSYDSFGNITETERPNSAGVTVKNTYSYENSSWRDLLTAYNGHTITYDKIGNPLSYYNGRSYTLRWEMGRQLLSSRVNSRTVYYDYNKDGIRIEKNVSGRYTLYPRRQQGHRNGAHEERFVRQGCLSLHL